MKYNWLRKASSLLILVPLFASCSARNADVTKAYLNYRYNLQRAGDIHGLDPTSNEVLDRNPGYTSYINLFNRNDSFINFQCKGTSYDDFYCEASFKLCDIDNNVLLEKESFRCSYTGGQSGTIIYSDDEANEYIGTIYVYTPYWCRWQYEYDVDNSGNKMLLTFEFWKGKYNPLPDFLIIEEEPTNNE